LATTEERCQTSVSQQKGVIDGNQEGGDALFFRRLNFMIQKKRATHQAMHRPKD